MRTTKINLLAALLVVFSLAVVSCESGESSEGASTPAEAAEGFLEAMTTGDMDGAKTLATQASTQELDMMADMGESWEGATYELGEVTEEDGSATAAYTLDGENQSLNLVESDGEWKVDYEFMMPGEAPMEDEMMEEMEGEMEEAGEEEEQDKEPSLDKSEMEEEKAGDDDKPTMQDESKPGGGS